MQTSTPVVTVTETVVQQPQVTVQEPVTIEPQQPAPAPAAPVDCGTTVPSFDGNVAASHLDLNGDCFVDQDELQVAIRGGQAG